MAAVGWASGPHLLLGRLEAAAAGPSPDMLRLRHPRRDVGGGGRRRRGGAPAAAATHAALLLHDRAEVVQAGHALAVVPAPLPVLVERFLVVACAIGRPVANTSLLVVVDSLVWRSRPTVTDRQRCDQAGYAQIKAG